jgi:hypothetical protein
MEQDTMDNTEPDKATVKNGLKRPLNLWLDQDANELLIAEKERSGTSLTVLINDAVRKTYGCGVN